MLHIDSDYDKAKHIKANGPNAMQYPNYEVAQINDHHQIIYSCRKLPSPLVARDWLNRGIFTQINDNKFVLVFKFIDEATATDMAPYTPSTLKLGEKRIRGESTFLCIFDRLLYNCCRFTYVAKADIKGSVPKVVAESGLSGIVEAVRDAYRYFERNEEVSKQNRGGVRVAERPSERNQEKSLWFGLVWSLLAKIRRRR